MHAQNGVSRESQSQTNTNIHRSHIGYHPLISTSHCSSRRVYQREPSNKRYPLASGPSICCVQTSSERESTEVHHTNIKHRSSSRVSYQRMRKPGTVEIAATSTEISIVAQAQRAIVARKKKQSQHSNHKYSSLTLKIESQINILISEPHSSS